ncbi:MAG: ABC transporter permease [Bauldia sp.]
MRGAVFMTSAGAHATTAIDRTIAATRAAFGPGRIEIRFAAIWFALAALLIFSAIWAPGSLRPDTLLAVIPFAAFLTITAMGQSILLMSRGIDLSVPAIITLSSTVLLGFSGGSDGALFVGLVAALICATTVGLINGILVGVIKLNALIVTLAVGAIASGATQWFRQELPPESRVPPLLADFGDVRLLGVNAAVWVAAILVAALTIVLRKTTVGRRFSAAGANPRAAWVAGINLPAHQIAAYGVAGFLYGVAGILLSAFIRNPTLSVGNDYLLAPIAAAVLGGTAITGGISSMVAVAGAALFLTQLGQMLKVLGLSSAIQLVVQGIAIALGMALAEGRWMRLGRRE